MLGSDDSKRYQAESNQTLLYSKGSRVISICLTLGKFEITLTLDTINNRPT